MPICPDLVNIFDLALFRPVRQGYGMDPSAPALTIADKLSAIFEPVQVLARGESERDLLIRAKFFIDGTDNDGEVIDIRADDWLQFTDFRGVLQKKQLIRRVSPWYCGPLLDHVLLEVS